MNSWLSKAFQKNSWPFLKSLFLTLNRGQSRLSSAADNWMRKRNQRLHWFCLTLPIVSFAAGSWDAKAATILINWFWKTGATFPTNQIQNLNRLRLCTRTRVLTCFSLKGYLSYSPSSWLACNWVKCALISKYFPTSTTDTPAVPSPLNLIVNSLCPDQDNSLLQVWL